MGSLMSQRTVSMTFFTGHCVWNFFFTVLTQANSGKPMFSPLI